jgi:multiple sugar transport system substrate-binding protein
MKKLNLITLIVLAALVASAFGIAGNIRAQDKTTITLWGDWSGEGEQQILTMVNAFNESQDQIVVEYVVIQDIVTNFLTAATSGEVPDVIIWDRWRTALYGPRNVLLPLNDYMARDGITADQFFAEALRELSVGETIYGLPLTVDARALFYNAALLREAGIEPPTTWEELKTAAEALTVRNADGTLERAGFSLQDVGLFRMWLLQAGSEAISEDGNTTTFNNEQGLAVLNYWQSLLDAGVYEVGFEQGLGQDQDAFVTGRVAMQYNGPWMLSTYEKFGDDLEFGVVPPPAGPNGDRGAGMGGFGLAIAAGSENPDAAWEFVKWWTADPENALTWSQTSRNICGNIECTQDPYFQEDPILRAFVETLEFASVRPTFPGYSAMEVDALIPNLQLFINGELTAEETLARAQEQGDIVLAENNQQ